MSDLNQVVTVRILRDAFAANNTEMKQFILGALAANNDILERNMEKRMHTLIRESEDRLGKRIDKVEKGLRSDMMAGFASIGDNLSRNNDILDQHEKRLTQLEIATNLKTV